MSVGLTMRDLIAQNKSIDRKVIALEKDIELLKSASKSWKEANLENIIIPYQGDALESLTLKSIELRNETQGNGFDMCYIDADKARTENYFEECFKLTRTGGVIAIDNVFAHGDIMKEGEELKKNGKIMKTFMEKMRSDQRVVTSIVSVGDGMALFVKK